MSHKKIYIVATIIILSVSSFFIPKMVGNKMLSSNVTTASLLSNYDFGYIFQNGVYQTYIGTSWTGGDKGHVNQLYYNFMIDGYGGLPMGSCLQRSMFLTNPTEKAKCTPVENSDLFRSDNSTQSPAKNLLLKNMTIKNAFRTGNAWGGTANINGVAIANPYTSVLQLPHVDTFQSYMGVAKKSVWDDVNKKWIQVDDTEQNNKPEWMVIQDSVIKNSDNGAMIVGGTWWDGIVYQNLTTFCESAFVADAVARINNDKNNFVGSAVGGAAPCGNEIGAETFGQSPVWLINVYSGKKITINNPRKSLAGPVIIIGNNTVAGEKINKDSLKTIQEAHILSQDYINGSWTTPSAHPNVKYYDYIEDAVAAGYQKPPYVELSCSGWRNPPAGCTTKQGYLEDTTPIVLPTNPTDSNTTPTTPLTFGIGNKVKVENNKTVNVRTLPDLQGNLRGTQTQGNNGIILDGPKQEDNIIWWYVDYETGVDGWIGQDTHSVIATNVVEPGNQYTLTSNSTNGTITGNLVSYRNGVIAYLTAVPSDGYQITGWTGCTTSNDTVCEVTMTNNKTVQAQFEEIPVARVCRPWN